MKILVTARPQSSHRWLSCVLSAALLGVALAPITLQADNPSEPYRQLRETVGGYNGASEDFRDLTEIRIGWFGPSDATDPINGDFWWAAQFAVQEANEQRNIKDPTAFAALPIRLVPRWAPDPWRAGVSLLARMVYEEPPLALIGSIDSASTHLAEQVIAKANLPLVSPIATDKTATLAGVSWMFACAPDDTVIARALVDGILQMDTAATKKSSIVLIATTDHASRMAAHEVTRELASHGVTPEFRFDLPPGVANAEEALQGAAGAHPAAVLVLADATDSARVTRALRAQQGAVTVFGGQAMGRARFLELAGPTGEGVRFPVLFAPGATDPTTDHFTVRFAAARGHEPDYAAALAYDSTRLLVEAIHRAGPNRARIREALVQLSPWSGIAGRITFDGTGQNHSTGVRLGTIQQGKVVIDPLPASTAPFSSNVSPP